MNIWIRFSWNLMFIYFLEVINGKEVKNNSVEKNLIRHLMSNYQHYGINGRPVRNSSIKVDVSYGLALIQILGLDEDSQILRTNCWGRYKWYDELMTWKPSDFGNIEQIRVFKDQIWIPDIQLFNFADTRLKTHRDARLVVYSNGLILWVPQALFKTSCPVEISYFPFDVQICRMDFGSWTYDINQLDLNWWVSDNPNFGDKPIPYIDFEAYIVNNEWITDGQKEKDVIPTQRTLQIKSQRLIRKLNVTDGDRMVEKSYRLLRYRIRLRRKPSFYVFILIIPCVLLSSLVITVFWLPPESPAKLLLGMNIFVAFFVLLLLLKSSIPTAAPKFPLIGSFFCLNMVMITLSTFLVTIVINFYIRGDKKGPIPNCIRRFMIDGVGRLLYVSQFINLPKKGENSRINIQHEKQETEQEEYQQKKVNERASRQRFQKTQQMEKRSLSQSNGANQQRQFSTSIMNNAPHEWDPTDSPLMGSDCQYLSYQKDKSSLEYNVRDIKRFVRQYVTKQKEVHRRNQMTMEWRTLALVLDRLFFIFYIATIAIAVIVAIPTNEDLLKMEEEPVNTKNVNN